MTPQIALLTLIVGGAVLRIFRLGNSTFPVLGPVTP